MNPHLLVGGKVSTLANLIKRHTHPPDELYAAPEVTRMQGMIIGYLTEHDGGALQKEIEETFMLRPSTVSRTLKLMDQNGLIERIYLKDDARQKRIVLTEKAREAHAGVMAHIQSVEEQLVRGVPAEELAVFHKVLTQMIDNMHT